MKVVCWNVQGVKKTQVLQEVKFLTRTHKPNLFFLLETMINESNIQRILPLMGFEHFDFISPINHFGGVTVLWNNEDIHASVLFKETRTIHMLVHNPNKVQNSVISGIYALAQPRDKRDFWNHLVELNKVTDLPWYLMGDFNEILCPNEKLGGQPPATTRFHCLNDFLSVINAECVQVLGSLFTWKKKIHTHLICKRLDRTMILKDWSTFYPDAYETHGNFSYRYHCHIIMSTQAHLQMAKAFSFRFQNF